MRDYSRRANINRMTPAERAIYDAMCAVEAVGADPLLTDAVVLLQQARDKVGDYVEHEARTERSDEPTIERPLPAKP